MSPTMSIKLGLGTLQPTALLGRPSLVIITAQQAQSHFNGQRRHHSRKRHLHSTSPHDVAVPMSLPVPMKASALSTQARATPASNASPLAALPFSQILRTYFVTSISSSSFLLRTSTTLLRGMLESKNPLFRIESNPLLRVLLWETFYKQFCAGSNAVDIAQTCRDLREQGYGGIILEYALEVLKDAHTDEAQDVAIWRKGMLGSIEMSTPGDFVGLKWSGMGPAAMNRMKDMLPPTKTMEEAMNAVCLSAMQKDVALLPAAEETWNLDGFHAWSLGLQKKYNVRGKSVVYNTYQAYLKQTARTLAEHMAVAKNEGFTLGVKLVRGAYLGSEKRELIWPSIEGTHHAYDTTMTALIQRRYNDVLTSTSENPDEEFPHLNVVLATHNAVTVAKAQALRRDQVLGGETLTPLAYAQLQGMADEVSCSLLASITSEGGSAQDKVFKCTTWGSMFECLNYLLRRAAENKDAAGRTSETRKAMQAELVRRILSLRLGRS